MISLIYSYIYIVAYSLLKSCSAQLFDKIKCLSDIKKISKLRAGGK